MSRAEDRRVSPPILQNGFRPFFLFGSLWAALALHMSLATLAGTISLPTAMPASAWHGHEMLFGYLAAIIAAFLLTAIPSWTGRPPVRGVPLAGLVLLWLLGRLAVLTGDWIGAWPVLLLDMAFPLVLVAIVARGITAGRKWRNLPIAALIVLFALGNLLSHLEALAVLPTEMLGERLAVAVGATLIVLIGGRITPTFTTNWLRVRGATRLPAPFGRLDAAVMALTGLALLVWLALPAGVVTGCLLLGAAAGTVIRLARWRGAATFAEPLLVVLHLGYAWLALGLALLGAAALDLVPSAAALHAVTAGASGTMTLAVMTRAALGHTGRALTADRWTTVIHLLVNLGVLARLAAFWAPAAYLTLLHLAGLAWGGAFLLYALRYAPILLGAKPLPAAPEPRAPTGRATGSRSPA